MGGGPDNFWNIGNMTGSVELPDSIEESEEWSEWSRCSEDCKRKRSRNGEVDEEYCDIGVDDCEGKG